MDTTPDPKPDGQSVWIWFGQPKVGRRFVIMVAVNGNERGGIVYRPLVYVDRQQAEDRGRPLAESAAGALGVDVELTEYRLHAVLDQVGAGR